jgi:hypothetical protein
MKLVMVSCGLASVLGLPATDGNASKMEENRPTGVTTVASGSTDTKGGSEKGTGNSTDTQCELHGGCWPHMYILGAQKSGTTSMFDQMTDQGACGAGSGTGKEGHFFDTKWRPGMGIDKYIKTYGGGHNHRCDGDYYIDATPDYIRHWFAPQRMKDFIPAIQQPKLTFLVMLREPIARDLSYYNHMLSNHLAGHQRMSAGAGQDVCSPDYLNYAATEGTAPTYTEHVACEMTIWDQCVADSKKSSISAYEACQNMERELKGGETGLTFLSSGMYSEQINRWKVYWPRHQMLVVQMEDLLANTLDYMTTVYKFMGFPAPPMGVLPNDNVQDYPFTVTEIDCPTKNKLKEVFEPYNNRLYKMLKEDQAAGGGAPNMEPKFPKWDDVKSVKCTPDPMKRPHATKKDLRLLAKKAAQKAAEDVLALQPSDDA